MKRTITPEHRAKLMDNIARARSLNPLVNKSLPDLTDQPKGNVQPDGNEIEAKLIVDSLGMRNRQLRMHTTRYLDSIHSVKDFEKVRRQEPKWALVFATELIWGKPGAGISPGGSSQAGTTVAVLVKVLTGDQHTQPVVFDAKALTFNDRTVEENKGESGQNDETGKPENPLGTPASLEGSIRQPVDSE